MFGKKILRKKFKKNVGKIFFFLILERSFDEKILEK